jgi:hypothetical protein
MYMRRSRLWNEEQNLVAFWVATTYSARSIYHLVPLNPKHEPQH